MISRIASTNGTRLVCALVINAALDFLLDGKDVRSVNHSHAELERTGQHFYRGVRATFSNG